MTQLATAPRSKYDTEQSVGTPWEFIDAVETRFGHLWFDLAADAVNHKIRNGLQTMKPYFDEADDSFSKPWAEIFPRGNLWLNPTFRNAAEWAEKCAHETRRRHGFILTLWPASVGSNWYDDYVKDNAFSLGLRPRVRFIGHPHAYPKDLMLSVFGFGLRGFDTWRWKE
jgi:hypothetical protein